MPEKTALMGQCMCGAVRFSATADKPEVTACHCDMCRRWASGPYLAVRCSGVAFEGEDAVSRIRSSDWAERGFCARCGSNLFYQLVGSDEFFISAGLIEDQSIFRMSLQVFTDSRPPYYEFAGETEMMTGEEVFAAFAPAAD